MLDQNPLESLLGDITMKLPAYKPRYVQLKEPITSTAQLEAKGFKNLQELGVLQQENKDTYPILTNGYYARLIDQDDPDDPIRKLVIPTKQELVAYYQGVSVSTGSFDTSGEATNLKAPGLQHKYKPTALALISNVCASLCRECFRKRLFIEHKHDEALFPNPEAIAYLERHTEINSILLSGGDALMLTNEAIRDILDILSGSTLEHIRTVRFGSKVHAFYPQRIDEELCKILADFQKKTGKIVHVCTHFEHAKEITEETRKACALMRRHGLELYNQTVLLKGVNDDPYVLYQLFEELASIGVRPYYLFQCRPVIGTYHFRLTLNEGVRIHQELMQLMTGVHKPRYAMSTPHGKMEILGTHPENEDVIVLKLHSSKTAPETGNVILYDTKANNPHWYEASEADTRIFDSAEELVTEED